MARRAQERREPTFDGGGRGGDFRVTAEDRPTVAVREAPARRRGRAREPEWDTDDGGPPERGRRRGKGGGRPPRRGKARRKRSLLGRLVSFTLVCAIWGFVALAGVVAWFAASLPPMSELEVPERPPSIALVGTTGEVMVNRGLMGQAIRLRDLPQHLPRAVLAVEDRRFYSHLGIDPIGVARALFRNATGRAIGAAEGGSTITQQLAKNIFLTHERSMGRKIQEAILAFWLEARFSKDEILEMYLNRVYFGAGAYGVEAAAQRYFGKSARQVTLQEAAVLAGLLQAPSRYAPSRNPEAAMARGRTVLGTMVAAGYITAMDAQVAGALPLRVRPADPQGNSIQYAADWIMDTLPQLIGTVAQDIVVETTIDPGLQREAERALRETIDRDGARYQVSQGAVVTVDVNGAVRALVGGRSYADSQFNRAVTARRQPGSSFKPFVYLAALERGLTPDTVREDSPVNIRGWSPENFTRRYGGNVTLRDALAQSINTVAARLGVEVGPRAVVGVAERLGVASPLQANASIALGTSEVSVLDMARAYVPFANGGASVGPHVVRRIRTADGRRVLYERPGDNGQRVVRADHVAMMNQMLARAVDVGTARNARVPGWTVAGKTGTSQEYRDAWFVGYTAQMVTAVWMGNDDGTPTRRASGGGLPTTVWSRVMTLAHQGLPPLALPGGGQPLPAPERGPPASIDDIMINDGSPLAAVDRQARQRPPTQQAAARAHAPGQQSPGQPCALDGNFLGCVFGAR